MEPDTMYIMHVSTKKRISTPKCYYQACTTEYTKVINEVTFPCYKIPHITTIVHDTQRQ